MELVFENGQILAKSQRSNGSSLQNQRTKSIVDLYEAEYNEDFKKSIIHGSDKNLVDTQTMKASSTKRIVVDYENRKDMEFIPPDVQSVAAEREVELGYESTDFTEDSEESTYQSTSLDDDDERPRVPGRTSKVLVKRRRKEKQANDMNKKMRTLQDLLPNSQKDDKESLLDEAVNYMTTLQLQVQMMTMGNRFVTPAPMMLHYSQMGPARGMQMGVPQWPVLGAGLPLVSSSAHVSSVVNHHPGLMPIQNSTLHTPTEKYFPLSVPLACAAFPNQIPNSTTWSNLDDNATTDGGTLSGKKVRK